MRLLKLSTGALALVYLTFTLPAFAQGKSGSHGPSTKATPHTSTAPTTHGPSTKTSGAPKTTGSSAKVKGPTAKTTAKADTKSATSKKTASTSTSTTPTTTPTTTTTVDFTSGKAGQLLTKNSALRSKLETRLQALGYTGTVYQAVYGFKNAGQAVASINIAQNLGVPWEQLKLSMTGLAVDPVTGMVTKANLAPDGTVTMVDPALATNPAPTKSLGQSIQAAKAGVDGTTAAQTATTQAEAEISGTSTTSRTSASTATAKKSTKKAAKPGTRS